MMGFSNNRVIAPPPYLQFCHHFPFPTPLLLKSRFIISPKLTYPSFSLDLHHEGIRVSFSTSSDSPVVTSPMASSLSSAELKPFSVLFVCLGNICRSPAAEGVFTDMVQKRGVESKFKIDSAGTIGYHEGNPADPRMRSASKRRGIEVTSRSRPIRPSDFRDFDLILAMDMQNKDDILGALERWRFKETLPDDAHKKVELMCSYCKKHTEKEVPDPYYGGPQGFEKVLDLLEDACESLLDSILAKNSLISGPQITC
ncbi:hypothetical protein MKW94_021248 [Papaver nudicaule]|uniref:acid phosphatase n=1 Tax=Papaver nudicaule TaxID=74823 RepID=A0AA41SDK4_PAPNU|nr:hypothetical protein [Papaver nudicaule]